MLIAFSLLSLAGIGASGIKQTLEMSVRPYASKWRHSVARSRIEKS